MHPILFQIGSFKVHSYGVVLIFAFLIGLWVARKRAPAFGISPSKLSDMAFLALIVGVLGARIAYLLQDPPKDWHEYFSLQFAGLTSFGALIGGAIVVLVWSKRTKTPLRPLLDVMAPTILIGWGIGRIGCLLNGCCYGGVCPPSFPLGVHTPENAFLHYPAPLYDSIMNVIGFGLLLWIEKRARLQVGQLFALALGFWGLSRIVDEFWRAGSVANVERGLASSTYWGTMPITQAQVAAGVVVLIAVGVWFGCRRKPATKEAQDPVPA